MPTKIAPLVMNPVSAPPRAAAGKEQRIVGSYVFTGTWVPQAPSSAAWAPVFDGRPVAHGPVRLELKGTTEDGGLRVAMSFEYPTLGKNGALATREKASGTGVLYPNSYRGEPSRAWLGRVGDMPFLVGVVVDAKNGKLTQIAVNGQASLKHDQVLPSFFAHTNVPVLGAK